MPSRTVSPKSPNLKQLDVEAVSLVDADDGHGTPSFGRRVMRQRNQVITYSQTPDGKKTLAMIFLSFFIIIVGKLFFGGDFVSFIV